jgi:hypothetical protein
VCADDQVELKYELLRKVSIHDDKMGSTHLIDVLDLMLGRGEGVDLDVEGVGEEDCVVALW